MGGRVGMRLAHAAPCCAPSLPPLPPRCLPALLQPFAVTVDTQALLVMDFHAHLRWVGGSEGAMSGCVTTPAAALHGSFLRPPLLTCAPHPALPPRSTCEVIGLLGGTFDAERRVLEIREAYPCRRADGQASGARSRAAGSGCGLGWAGLDWAGLAWTGLDWTGLDRCAWRVRERHAAAPS